MIKAIYRFTESQPKFQGHSSHKLELGEGQVPKMHVAQSQKAKATKTTTRLRWEVANQIYITETEKQKLQSNRDKYIVQLNRRLRIKQTLRFLAFGSGQRFWKETLGEG